MERLKQLFSTDDEGHDALRMLGGLLLATGMLLAFARKGSPQFFDGKHARDSVQFAILLLATGFLYVTAMLGSIAPGRFRSWQPVYVVFAIVLVPITMFKLVDGLAGDPSSGLNVAWIFLFTAILAAATASTVRARYAVLLCAAALVVSWLGLWDEILAKGLAGEMGKFRGLLVVAALALLGGAAGIHALDRTERGLRSALEVSTVAFAAAVLAGALSFTKFLEAKGLNVPVADPSVVWDLELLVASLLAIALGAGVGIRGPVYVGAVGLLAFVTSVGLDLDAAHPRPGLIGWPLIVVIVGGAAVLASAIPGLRVGSLGFDKLHPDDGDTDSPSS